MSSDPTTHPADATGPVTLSIGGMSCGHCVAAVSAALGQVPGLTVERVAVGSATVRPAAPDAGVIDDAVRAVSDAGYHARVAPATPARPVRSSRVLPQA